MWLPCAHHPRGSCGRRDCPKRAQTKRDGGGRSGLRASPVLSSTTVSPKPACRPFFPTQRRSGRRRANEDSTANHNPRTVAERARYGFRDSCETAVHTCTLCTQHLPVGEVVRPCLDERRASPGEQCSLDDAESPSRTMTTLFLGSIKLPTRTLRLRNRFHLPWTSPRAPF